MQNFYQWNCVSLFRKYSTLDFVIPKDEELMALLHVGGRFICKYQTEYLSLIRKLRFKMKLSYECWKRDCVLTQLVKGAILKTIEEKEKLAVANLQKHIAKSIEYRGIERDLLLDPDQVDRKKREKLALHLRTLQHGLKYRDLKQFIAK